MEFIIPERPVGRAGMMKQLPKNLYAVGNSADKRILLSASTLEVHQPSAGGRREPSANS